MRGNMAQPSRGKRDHIFPHIKFGSFPNANTSAQELLNNQKHRYPGARGEHKAQGLAGGLPIGVDKGQKNTHPGPSK